MYEARQNRRNIFRQVETDGGAKHALQMKEKITYIQSAMVKPHYHENLNNSIQRKIGFEFQTVGENWNVKKITRKKTDGTFQLGEPNHGEEIYRDGNLSVQTDSTDLEYVTDSFDERNPKDEDILINTIENASKRHTLYASGKNEFLLIQPNSKNIDGKINNKEEISEKNLGWWIVNGKGTKNAHPQATVGIRLEYIHDFIKRSLLNAGDGKELISTPKPVIDKLNARNIIRATNNRISKSGKSELGPIQMGLAELVLQNIAMIKAFFFKNSKQGERGLINAKNSMAFMNRTSLEYIYNALDPIPKITLIAFFKKQPEYMDPHAYVAYQEDPKDSEKDDKVLFSEWVNILEANSKDMLANRYNSISELSMPLGLNRFNVNRPTDIGHDTQSQEVDGALLELRALRRNVPPKKWSVIAKYVINLLNEVNKGPISKT